MPPLLTIRVPELNPSSDVDVINDQAIIWQAADNQTRKISLAELRTLIITGGPATIPPVIQAGTLLYIVPPADAGTDTASIPEAAGKSFILRRTSLGMMEPPFLADGSPNPDKEYDILAGGGFKLTIPGDVLILGERFEVIFYQLAPVIGPGTDTGLEFIKGNKIVNTNYSLVAGDMNKVIHIRDNPMLATTQLVFTLPDVDDVPSNAVAIFDTQIDGDLISVEHKIQTTGGQLIYMQGISRTSLYIRTGETLWLYRDDDGWHVINDFGKVYDSIGRIEWVWKKKRNQIPLDGTLQTNTDYARLYEYIQTLGGSYVTDAVWLTANITVSGRTVANPYRGCFSSGDGTRFRVPDYRNVFIRSLSDYTGVDDPERGESTKNKSGVFQDDQFRSHFHATGVEPANNSIFKRIFSALVRNWNTGNTDVATKQASTDITGGIETRGPNIGMIPVINV